MLSSCNSSISKCTSANHIMLNPRHAAVMRVLCFCLLIHFVVLQVENPYKWVNKSSPLNGIKQNCEDVGHLLFPHTNTTSSFLLWKCCMLQFLSGVNSWCWTGYLTVCPKPSVWYLQDDIMQWWVQNFVQGGVLQQTRREGWDTKNVKQRNEKWTDSRASWISNFFRRLPPCPPGRLIQQPLQYNQEAGLGTFLHCMASMGPQVSSVVFFC